MLINTHLTLDCLKAPLFEVATIKPYEQSIYHWQEAFRPNHTSKIGLTFPPIPLAERIKHILIAFCLMIPLINTIAIFILRHLDNQIDRNKPATRIQAFYKMFKAKEKLKQIKSAIKIQRCYRKFRPKLHAAIKIQSFGRMICAKNEFNKLKTAALRDRLGEKLIIKFLQLKRGIKAVKMIQTHYRAHLTAKGFYSKKHGPDLSDKALKMIFSAEGQKMIAKTTGIKLDSAVFSAANVVGAVKSLKQGKFRLAYIQTWLALGNGVQAISNILIPKELKLITKYSAQMESGRFEDL
jgi:hypothetical protein